MFEPRHKLILVLAEEDTPLEAAVEALSEAGYAVAPAHSPEEALLLARERAFDLFLVPVGLRHGRIEDLIRALRKLRSTVSLVALVDAGRVLEAVALMRSGVEDYLVRPPHPLEIRARIGRILERHELDTQVSFLHGEISKRLEPRDLLSRSPGMDGLVRRLKRIAPMKSTVLILGESGSGKELVARAIHYHSPRKNQPFVALNCSAIPESLIESELFGHEKGAYTGAFSRVPGKFEIAHRGTLFLDEIGEMRRETQAKLLRVLEEREFMRIGGDQTVAASGTGSPAPEWRTRPTACPP